MTKFLVKIICQSYEKLLELDNFNLDLNKHTARKEDTNKFVVSGILTDDEIQKIKLADYEVEILSDLTQAGKERSKEVSKENRFSKTERVARDLSERAISEKYMNADEIESYLVNLNQLHPDITSLIELPNKSVEGKVSHALHLHANKDNNDIDNKRNNNDERIGILITGSMHAREWGGSDICVNFIGNMVSAYINNTPITYGNKKFSADQIKDTLQKIDLFVFPDVNPDGKVYSQSNDDPSLPPEDQGIWWRKNRNTTAVPNGDNPNHLTGVDINRNFDFLWGSGIGTVRPDGRNRSETYKGTKAFSEPETQNVCHLLDSFKINYYIDIHSYGELILYSWGDDTNQNIDPNQNFLNPLYDGVRGNPLNQEYGEYILKDDEKKLKSLADSIYKAVEDVRGSKYTVQQSVGLYPTSATSDDYVFCRHIINSSNTKTYGFTIEFGGESIGFIPSYPEMKNIIDEISAGLTELCIKVA
jgi:murein tripeptide amidase MpaA